MKWDENKKQYLSSHWDILICLFLTMAVIAVFWQVVHYAFVYDDFQYIVKNDHVTSGLRFKNLLWAFTSSYASNWHPLTWLSHMLDVQLFGMNPGRHHLANLLFHIANTLLLFVVFKRMTGYLWQSAMVAALFALHPLHVESVAWVAERKDVLSTFFWLLTMWCYVWYVEHGNANRYLITLVSFSLGLMAKPMLVTLPFVLLLMDYWPLKRLHLLPSSQFRLSILGKRVWEKVPFFILSAASSAVTLVAQKTGGSVGPLGEYPFHFRTANALVSYAAYLIKSIWPFNLSVLYPLSINIPVWQTAGAGLLLAMMSLVVIRNLQKRPYLAAGWFWYLGTLIPVIGLVQVGNQAMADRYTYVPLIGIFIMVAWGIPDLLAKWRHGRLAMGIGGAVLFLILMEITWRQTGYWRNDITLFSHAIDVTSRNHVAHYNLGNQFLNQWRNVKAIQQYESALKIKPDFAEAHGNLGLALARQGETDGAIRHYSHALKINPGLVALYHNLGLVLAKQGRLDEAIRNFSKAVRLNPHNANGFNDLGFALARQGRMSEAIQHYHRALRLNPRLAVSYVNLSDALVAQGKIDEAASALQEALRIIPGNERWHHKLRLLMENHGNQ